MIARRLADSAANRGARPGCGRPGSDAGGCPWAFGPADAGGIPSRRDRRFPARPRLPCSRADEQLFRDSLFEFADRESGRSSARWTTAPQIPGELIAQLFELGVMGIEVPDALGWRRRHRSCTRCWRSNRSRASTRRSACSSTCRTRWSSTRSPAGAPTRRSRRTSPRWPATSSGPMPCRKPARAAMRLR